MNKKCKIYTSYFVNIVLKLTKKLNSCKIKYIQRMEVEVMKKYVRIAVYFILFAVLIGAFIYLGEKDFKEEKDLTDAQRFAYEYNIDHNNMFKYSYGSEIVDVIKNKTGIIFLGFANNDWSKYYVKYLYDVLKLNNIKNVYYYDLQRDRGTSTKYYRELERLLSDYLYKQDTGETRIYTPALIFVKDGKIIHFDDETSINRNNIKAEDYWTVDKIGAFKGKIDAYLKEVNYNE